MGTSRFLSTVTIVGILAAGCSSGDSEEATTTTTAAVVEDESSTTIEATTTTEAAVTTEAAEATTTEVSVGALPDTPIKATLGGGYDFQGGTPDAASLPAPEGSVEAQWFRAGDVYAVIYVGLDSTIDACPGNSALTPAGFDFVSNAELPNGACPGFQSRIDNNEAQGVQICGDQVGYLTLIPSDTVAQVFASVETPDDAVGGFGITAPARIDDPSAVPEIDPASLSC